MLELGKHYGLNIFDFNAILKAGETANPAPFFNEPVPEQVFMLCFTSGTTGDAKGAKETQNAFVSNLY